ncbi:MAG: 2-oxo acid dehydrogenase subunit E2 [Propionibacteriaceae bacterium]|nr:2-oxo acid dehydrogenase subunit E2 [Propionibacteriaceae bacterium]
MATYLRMPGLSADAEDAILIDWLVETGASLAKGDLVATVETDKANVDIECDRAATVYRLLVPAGATVPVGDPIAILITEGETESAGNALLADLQQGASGKTKSTQEAPPEPPQELPTPPVVERGRTFASPLARRLARKHDIDVSTVVGTGPMGRIVGKDVDRLVEQRRTLDSSPDVEGGTGVAAPLSMPYAGTAAPVPPGASVFGVSAPPPALDAIAPRTTGEFVDTPHTRLRAAVARRLQASKQTAPHFYLSQTLKVDELLSLRQQINAAQSVKVSLNDLVVKAAARALRDVPEMNVIWTDESVRQFDSVDIAVAVASERGLMTPVVQNADQMPLSTLSAAIRDKAARAGEGKLSPPELEGGTMTVTNLGMYGVENFAAIINPPHASILAVGAVGKAVLADENDQLTVAAVMHVTLSVDHRPVDGVLAARWLACFKDMIEHPLAILI